MDDNVIKRRITAREKARAVISLLVEEASSITPDTIALEAFWDEVRKSLPPVQNTYCSSDQPMTDEQARIFGSSLMPFGEFKGKAVNTIPFDRLEWYSDSKFQKQLIRYLNSPAIKAERDERE